MEEGSFGANYRRGLVLGLTLAEVFLLLLFLLLGVFAYLLSLEERKTEYIHQAFIEHELPFQTEEDLKLSTQQLSKAYRDIEQVKQLVDNPNEFIETVQALEDIKELLGDLGIEIDDPNALTTRLTQMREEELVAEKYKDVCGDLDALKSQLETLHGEDKTAEEVLNSCPPSIDDDKKTLVEDEIPETVEEAIPIIERQKNQISSLTKRLKDMLGGKGLVYPPCWVRDGKTVYTYQVSIRDAGLYVDQGDDRAGMDLSALKRNGDEPQFGSIITSAAFNRKTKGMFEWSVENECRFFVRISDDTSVTNKQGYKSYLASIENHFYKLLLD